MADGEGERVSLPLNGAREGIMLVVAPLDKRSKERKEEEGQSKGEGGREGGKRIRELGEERREKEKMKMAGRKKVGLKKYRKSQEH